VSGGCTAQIRRPVAELGPPSPRWTVGELLEHFAQTPDAAWARDMAEVRDEGRAEPLRDRFAEG
jgi:hypothetical protein